MVTPDGKTRSLREYSPDNYGSPKRHTPELGPVKDVVPDYKRYPKFVRLDDFESEESVEEPVHKELSSQICDISSSRDETRERFLKNMRKSRVCMTEETDVVWM